jgi:hypothetical protein
MSISLLPLAFYCVLVPADRVPEGPLPGRDANLRRERERYRAGQF